MKTKNIAALLNENCKTIGVKFSNSNDHPEGRTYTYKTTEDFEAGDSAVVLTRGKLKVVSVVEVHKVAQIDLSSDTKYQWIVQKVDMSYYEELNNVEEEFSDQLLEIEQASVREKSVAMLKEHLGIEDGAVTSLIKLVNGKA